MTKVLCLYTTIYHTECIAAFLKSQQLLSGWYELTNTCWFLYIYVVSAWNRSGFRHMIPMIVVPFCLQKFYLHFVSIHYTTWVLSLNAVFSRCFFPFLMSNINNKLNYQVRFCETDLGIVLCSMRTVDTDQQFWICSLWYFPGLECFSKLNSVLKRVCPWPYFGRWFRFNGMQRLLWCKNKNIIIYAYPHCIQICYHIICFYIHFAPVNKQFCTQVLKCI